MTTAKTASNSFSRRFDPALLGSGSNAALDVQSRATALIELSSHRSDVLYAVLSPKTQEIERRIVNLRNSRSPSAMEFGGKKASIEERLFDATADVKILTSQVAMYLQPNWREKLFSQIDALHDSDEWDPQDEPLQKASFATFLKAICELRPQKRPGLGLSYSGLLIAAWTHGTNRLTIEFLANDRVKWVISKLSDREPEYYVGQTPVSRLMEGLRPHHPTQWFANA